MNNLATGLIDEVYNKCCEMFTSFNPFNIRDNYLPHLNQATISIALRCEITNPIIIMMDNFIFGNIGKVQCLSSEILNAFIHWFIQLHQLRNNIYPDLLYPTIGLVKLIVSYINIIDAKLFNKLQHLRVNTLKLITNASPHQCNSIALQNLLTNANELVKLIVEHVNLLIAKLYNSLKYLRLNTFKHIAPWCICLNQYAIKLPKNLTYHSTGRIELLVRYNKILQLFASLKQLAFNTFKDITASNSRSFKCSYILYKNLSYRGNRLASLIVKCINSLQVEIFNNPQHFRLNISTDNDSWCTQFHQLTDDKLLNKPKYLGLYILKHLTPKPYQLYQYLSTKLKNLVYYGIVRVILLLGYASILYAKIFNNPQYLRLNILKHNDPWCTQFHQLTDDKLLNKPKYLGLYTLKHLTPKPYQLYQYLSTKLKNLVYYGIVRVILLLGYASILHAKIFNNPQHLRLNILKHNTSKYFHFHQYLNIMLEILTYQSIKQLKLVVKHINILSVRLFDKPWQLGCNIFKYVIDRHSHSYQCAGIIFKDLAHHGSRLAKSTLEHASNFLKLLKRSILFSILKLIKLTIPFNKAKQIPMKLYLSLNNYTWNIDYSSQALCTHYFKSTYIGAVS